MNKIITAIAVATAISGAMALPASAHTSRQRDVEVPAARSEVMANTAERAGHGNTATVTGGPSGGLPNQQ